MLSHLAISAEGFIFNPSTGDSFQVSQTGLQIVNALREDKSENEIAQTLSDTYDVSLENAQRDLADFKSNLKFLGLL